MRRWTLPGDVIHRQLCLFRERSSLTSRASLSSRAGPQRVTQEVIGGPSSTTSDGSGLPLLRGLLGPCELVYGCPCSGHEKIPCERYTATIGIVHF